MSNIFIRLPNYYIKSTALASTILTAALHPGVVDLSGQPPLQPRRYGQYRLVAEKLWTESEVHVPLAIPAPTHGRWWRVMRHRLELRSS